MGDPAVATTPTTPIGGATTPTTNFYRILGLPKTASISDIGKAYKFLTMRWNPDKHTSNKAEAEARCKAIKEAYRVLSVKKREEGNYGLNQEGLKSPESESNNLRSPQNSFYTAEDGDFVISSPSLISSTSRRVTPVGTPRTFSHSSSRRSITPTSRDFYYSSSSSSASHSRSSSEASNNIPLSPSTPSTTDPIALAKMASRRNSTPIIFSHSATTSRRKPQPVEKKLECSLEELCTGSIKHVKITRDVISNEGLIIEEEEVLRIRIKPGWRKGTKITFEGKGDEKPGMHPADIIFIIEEKRHPIFKRSGDDLELGVEIPLVEALTGACLLSVPQLGGGHLSLSLDDDNIIFPGYEKIIPAKGMPNSKDGTTRGDLKLKFFVDFPLDLSQETRSELVSILQQCSS